MSKVLEAQGVFPGARVDELVSWERSDLWQQSANAPRATLDDLVQRKGLPIYERMMVDEQVKAVVYFKRDAILARGWQFKFDEETKLSEDERKSRIDLFNRITCKMDGSFSDALSGISSGRFFGYSLTEKVFQQIEYDGRTFVGIRKLLTRSPTSFEFYTDEFGVLQKFVQRINGQQQELDIRRFIHYVHGPEWDGYYGRSDLREAYRSWYSKQRAQDLWLLYLERMAGGLLVASIGTESSLTSKSPDYEALKSALSNARSLSSVILPKGVTLEVVSPAVTDQFQSTVTFLDQAIAKALLVPNLLGVSHTGQTGSFSQSQTQLDAFLWTLMADSARLEACLNEQLFRDLGDQNWGDGEYPEFCFKPMSQEQLRWVVDMWGKLTQLQAVVPTDKDEAHVRELLNMPPRDPEATTLADEAAKRNQANGLNPDGTMPPQLDPNKQVDQQAKVQDQAALAARLEKLEMALAEAAEEPTPTEPQPKAKMSAELYRASQRVHFGMIEQRTQVVASRIAPDLAQLVAKAVKRALGDDENLKALTDQDVADVAAWQLNSTDVSKLKDRFNSALTEGWRIGTDMAQNELERARKEAFTAEQRQVKFARLADKAADYFEANSFRMAGNLRDGARAIVQQNLMNSIKSGWTAAQTRANIWDSLVSKGFTDKRSVTLTEDDQAVLDLLDALNLDDVGDAAHYLNTLVRTNVFEAMNEARYNEFTDPALGDFVVAFEYSAILDGSTTVICKHLDDKVYGAKNPLWDTYRPPNHYNCRSVLIPITAIDSWDGKESPPPDVQPQEGFG
jgi:SPP1 gp7 family putative phage head morphogenesis protein